MTIGWTEAQRVILRDQGPITRLGKLAEMIGKSDNAVALFARRNGYAIKRVGSHPQDCSRPGYSEEEDDRIIALCAAGKSNPEIAEALGRTMRSLSDRIGRLRRAGRLRRPKWRGPRLGFAEATP